MSTENPYVTVKLDLKALAAGLDALNDQIREAPQFGDRTAIGILAGVDQEIIALATVIVQRLERNERFAPIHSAADDYFRPADESEDS